MKIFEILLNQDFLGAIFTVIIFIFIGYILVKKNIINDIGKNAITFIVMNISLPCLVFKSFLNDFNTDDLKTNIYVLIIALLGYILLLILGNIIFLKKERDKRNIYAIVIALSQVSLFTLPVINAIYNDSSSLIPVSIISIVFRIFLYGYSYIVFSRNCEKQSFGKQIKRIFLNPIVIAMLLGIIVWSTQNYLFRINLEGEKVSLLRIDKTLPALYNIISSASNTTTMFSMMLIGFSMGKFNLGDAVKSKLIWCLSILRAFVAPGVMLIIVIVFKRLLNIDLSEYQIAGLLIAFASPVSAVVNTYAIKFKKEDFIIGSSCFLSTILSIFSIPILYIIITLIS